jgi:hypothetical protein
METSTANEDIFPETDTWCPIAESVRPDLVETRQAKNGRPLYRIKGIAMAWCNSLLEALRVAHILIRAGRASTIELAV